MQTSSGFTKATSLLFVLSFVLACGDTHYPYKDGKDAGTDAKEADANVEPTACDEPADCVVTSVSCCGSCGVPTRDDITAVHVDDLEAHRAAACGDEWTCPACAAMPDPTLFATCANKRCEVVDLLAVDAGQCVEATDCIVRATACCECGADTSIGNVVAINASRRSEYEALVCPMDVACPECAPVYDPRSSASCDTTRGVCQIDWAAD